MFFKRDALEKKMENYFFPVLPVDAVDFSSSLHNHVTPSPATWSPFVKGRLTSTISEQGLAGMTNSSKQVGKQLQITEFT